MHLDFTVKQHTSPTVLYLVFSSSVDRRTSDESFLIFISSTKEDYCTSGPCIEVHNSLRFSLTSMPYITCAAGSFLVKQNKAASMCYLLPGVNILQNEVLTVEVNKYFSIKFINKMSHTTSSTFGGPELLQTNVCQTVWHDQSLSRCYCEH